MVTTGSCFVFDKHSFHLVASDSFDPNLHYVLSNLCNTIDISKLGDQFLVWDTLIMSFLSERVQGGINKITI